MRTVRFPDGTDVPALGQGTWMMGETGSDTAREVRALRAGIDCGMTLIDTAEMYADGGSERVVGEAIQGRRSDVFLVSKTYPHHASRDRLADACDASLKRLGTDRLDLYLLHWRGNIPLAETVEAMERLIQTGKVIRWGVSNLDLADMQELAMVGGEACATDQILYNLSRRGPEFDLIPWLMDRSIPVMAYSPVERGRLLAHEGLRTVAARHHATPAQVALAWLLRQRGMIVIPKAGSVEHVEDNRQAADLLLDDDDLGVLNRAFPPPSNRTPLEML
jgi:diketogulonate reductase-like aldo/keto reductase